MPSTKILFLILAKALAFKTPEFSCGTSISTSSIAAHESEFQQLLAQRGSDMLSRRATTKIEVFYHVINTSNGQGAISPDQLAEQTKVLNHAYQNAGLNFTTISVKTIIRDDWWAQRYSSDFDEMKMQLHTGGSFSLNVYIVGCELSRPNINGQSTFAADYRKNPGLDGILLSWTVLPSAKNSYGHNLGLVLVHEVGHWLGLYHTFEGGCGDLNGDYVDDTPAQATYTDLFVCPNGEPKCDQKIIGCPIGLDTCPSLPGLDLTSNHMDYSAEICQDGFTNGQIERMHQQINAFRLNP